MPSPPAYLVIVKATRGTILLLHHGLGVGAKSSADNVAIQGANPATLELFLQHQCCASLPLTLAR